MIKGHTDIDIWNTDFFVNADYFSDDFIIYHNTKSSPITSSSVLCSITIHTKQLILRLYFV